jgi:drug/metabolite transporter (DMT)-like permease
MPIFSALWGVLFFHTPLRLRGWLGVASAALAAMLLLWHEVSVLSGHPLGVMLMLVAAASWGYGTQRMRHTTATVATLTLAFWMTGLTTVVMCVLSWVFEPYPWVMPSERVWWAIAYNAIGVFGFAQPAWLILARNLPLLASTLSVMFIPVLGAFSGAWWLGEQLHWQDIAAVLLIVVAIASVLWPAREAVRQT